MVTFLRVSTRWTSRLAPMSRETDDPPGSPRSPNLRHWSNASHVSCKPSETLPEWAVGQTPCAAKCASAIARTSASVMVKRRAPGGIGSGFTLDADTGGSLRGGVSSKNCIFKHGQNYIRYDKMMPEAGVRLRVQTLGYGCARYHNVSSGFGNSFPGAGAGPVLAAAIGR